MPAAASWNHVLGHQRAVVYDEACHLQGMLPLSQGTHPFMSDRLPVHRRHLEERVAEIGLKRTGWFFGAPSWADPTPNLWLMSLSVYL